MTLNFENQVVELQDLWAAANRLTPYDAAVDLCQRLNVPLPLLSAQSTANREEEPVATG